jgi:hypothetical protein
MVHRWFVPIVLVSSLALAQGTEGPASAAAVATQDSDAPEAGEAKVLVTRYLNAVKAKKWADAKKFLHPKTLEAIAERKKRMGKEDHPMAPWFHEKVDYSLTAFNVGAASLGALGTVMVEVSEDNYQVADKGVANGEAAAYLVGKHGGKWLVVDKKMGEVFTKDSVKLGYKGWFDKLEPAAAPPPVTE